MAKKVVIGMSGGVDSSVAAYLLKEEGYDVTGVSMDMYEGITAPEIENAKKIAEKIGVNHMVMDMKGSFKQYVVNDFLDEYLQGHTPNPCVVCNKFIKWSGLEEVAKEIGADYIATGHYANVIKLENGRYSIKMANDSKDQSYVLYNMTQEQLSKCIMPCGKYDKAYIREIAAKIGLEVADKKDSMEICFIPDNDYIGFIKKCAGCKMDGFKPGNFVDTKGNVLGEHKGIACYTIGQRKGLGIAFGKPMFVVDINPETNEVVLGEGDEVFKKSLIAKDVNFISVEDLDGEMRVEAKIRYKHKAAPCTIKRLDESRVECVFDEPQRAITAGQSVVFYDGDIVVGGGVIVR